jgi:hypothetical protein
MSFDGQAEQWQPCRAEACRVQPRHPWITCPNYWVEWEWIQPGGWRATISAVELQLRFHRPREAGVVIGLVCGRCGKRTLDRLVANPDFPEAQSIWGISSELRQKAKALRDQRTGRLGKPVRGAVAVPSIQRDWMGRTAPEWACHPRRCGAVWRVRRERLAEAFIRVFEAGRRRIVLGVDV